MCAVPTGRTPARPHGPPPAQPDSATIFGLACRVLCEQRGVHADAALRAALVRGEREPQHVDGFLAAPQQRAVAGVQPAQPVAARVAKAAAPVVVERVVAAHLAIGVDLKAGLLDPAAGAPVDPREPLAAGDLPAL